MMISKYSLWGLAAGTALLFSTGCSKQESPTTPPADNATKSPAPAANEMPQGSQTPKTTDKQPAAPVKPEPAAPATPVPTPAPPAIPSATNLPPAAPKPAAVQPQTPTTDQAVAASGFAGTPPGAPTSASQSGSQPQQTPLAQAATNQFQALAAAASNRVLAALQPTNQVTLATNQVQALLERARTFTTNQNYQAALATLNQLYDTKLTPDQKQKVDDLKTQIQTSLAQKAASEATSALGNILGGKK